MYISLVQYFRNFFMKERLKEFFISRGNPAYEYVENYHNHIIPSLRFRLFR